MPRPVAADRVPRPYEMIAKTLRQQIASQDLKRGDRLPTVADLATAQGVSVGTAHRAVALLAGEGLLNVTRGQRATVK
jgi:integrase